MTFTSRGLETARSSVLPDDSRITNEVEVIISRKTLSNAVPTRQDKAPTAINAPEQSPHQTFKRLFPLQHHLAVRDLLLGGECRSRWVATSRRTRHQGK